MTETAHQCVRTWLEMANSYVTCAFSLTCPGERPFSCPHCNRAFADRSNLRAHLQTHAEVKKYQCGICSRTFSRMSLLQKHSSSGCCSTAVWSAAETDGGDPLRVLGTGWSSGPDTSPADPPARSQRACHGLLETTEPHSWIWRAFHLLCSMRETRIAYFPFLPT